MAKKVRFGIIGSAGLIGNYHSGVLTKEEGPYELTALCDINEARLRDQMNKLNLPGTTSAAELVARDDVDAVIVTTPHPLHCEHATLVVEAGKDVMTEKPLAATPGAARDLVKAINRNRRIGGIHYQSRSRPTVWKLKEMVTSGELGKILLIRVTGSYYKSDYYYRLGGWRGTWKDEGGGTLINQAPHDIDLMCHLGGDGEMPVEMMGRWTNHYHETSQVEDMASAIGVFPNGVEFVMNFSVSAHGDLSRIEVFGTAGAATLTGGEFTRYIRYKDDLVDFCRNYPGDNPYQGPEVEEQPLPECEPWDQSLIHKCFAEAVLTRKKKKLLVSAAEGRASMEVILGVYLSDYLGKKVKFPLPAGRYDKMLADLIANAPAVERGGQDSTTGMEAKF